MCTTSVSGGVRRFRFEDGTTILGSRGGESYTVQSSQLNQNGQYVCFDGGREWPFHIYFNNGEQYQKQVKIGSQLSGFHPVAGGGGGGGGGRGGASYPNSPAATQKIPTKVEITIEKSQLV